MDWIQVITAVSTIIGANYGLLKFMTKGDKEKLDLMKEQHNDFKDDMKSFRDDMKLIHAKHLAMEAKLDAHANRLDGIYRVILDRTYGVK